MYLQHTDLPSQQGGKQESSGKAAPWETSPPPECEEQAQRAVPSLSKDYKLTLFIHRFKVFKQKKTLRKAEIYSSCSFQKCH